MSKGLRCLLGVFAALLGLAAAPAQAQIGSDRYSAIVMDHRTGNVLVSANADETRHPASLTKMMTLYMVFEALRDGRLRLDSPIVMSAEASSRPPSKLGIPVGQIITTEQAILALVTRSANDVAAALGEQLGWSEQRFGQIMTMRARALGMTRTTFRNASGLPDSDQVTTARDMATLGRRLLNDFPNRYHYFGVTHAQFGGIRIRNHNRMLTDHEGVDGIKTGYIRDSGFNIVTSAERSGRRVVGAVFGGASWVERDAHMASLLDQSFEQLGVAPRQDFAARGVVVREASAGALPRPAVAAPAARAVAARPGAQIPRQVVARPAAVPRSAAVATARPVPQRVASQSASPRGVAAAPARLPAIRPPAAQPRQQAQPPARSLGTIRTAELR